MFILSFLSYFFAKKTILKLNTFPTYSLRQKGNHETKQTLNSQNI